MDYHKKGYYYSGVKEVGEDHSIHSHAPDTIMGAGALLLPFIWGFKLLIYNPVDFVFSGVVDTVYLPMDYLYYESVRDEEAYKNALEGGDSHYAIVQYKKGVYEKDEPLITAVCQGDYNTTAELLSTTPIVIGRKDQFRHNAMDYAIRLHDEKSVRLLLDHGVPNDLIYMRLISKDANISLLRKLMQTDVHERDIFEYTPLSAATDVNRSDIVMMLLENEDVNVNEVSSPWMQPILIKAILKKNLEIIKALLEAGAYVNAASDSGTTALGMAQGRFDVSVPLLKSYGATLKQRPFFEFPQDRTKDYERGTIIDHVSGLEWNNEEVLGHYEMQKYHYDKAQAYCRNSDYAGERDWRLPTKAEMLSISQSALFIEESSGGYWVEKGKNGEGFIFVEGAISPRDINEDIAAMRCVRGAKKVLEPLIFNENGYAVDPNTHIMWQISYKYDRQTERPWQIGLNYCESLKLGGFEDWHMPTGAMLRQVSIVEGFSDVFEVSEAYIYWGNDVFDTQELKDMTYVFDTIANRAYLRKKRSYGYREENYVFQTRCARKTKKFDPSVTK